MSLDTTLPEIDLEDLKKCIAPEEIAYFDLSWALPTRAMRVCKIIKDVNNVPVLEKLLAHSQTLHAPRGKEFPIERVRRAIVWRLQELGV